eukprot:6487712-Amphidinium_carterae.2
MSLVWRLNPTWILGAVSSEIFINDATGIPLEGPAADNDPLGAVNNVGDFFPTQGVESSTVLLQDQVGDFSAGHGVGVKAYASTSMEVELAANSAQVLPVEASDAASMELKLGPKVHKFLAAHCDSGSASKALQSSAKIGNFSSAHCDAASPQMELQSSAKIENFSNAHCDSASPPLAVQSGAKIGNFSNAHCDAAPPPMEVPSGAVFPDHRDLVLAEESSATSSFEDKVDAYLAQRQRWLITDVPGEDFVIAGWWGTGPALGAQSDCKRSFRDGGGWCSPGRWLPSNRTFPPLAQQFSDLLDAQLSLLEDDFVNKHTLAVLAGVAGASPFPEHLVLATRQKFAEALGKHGFPLPVLPRSRKGHSTEWALLASLARALQDPDASSIPDIARGVRIGYKCDLPRTPAVWSPKRAWGVSETPQDLFLALNENYPSAAEHLAHLETEVAAQMDKGWVVQMTLAEASAKFPEVRVAAIAVTEESNKYRTLFDATHHVHVNHHIKVLDQELFPDARDVRCAVQAAHSERPDRVAPWLALVIDGKSAHRQIPVAEADWGLQAFRLHPPNAQGEQTVYLNTVGTFGVTSASYHYARFADDHLILVEASRQGQALRELSKV